VRYLIGVIVHENPDESPVVGVRIGVIVNPRPVAMAAVPATVRDMVADHGCQMVYILKRLPDIVEFATAANAMFTGGQPLSVVYEADIENVAYTDFPGAPKGAPLSTVARVVRTPPAEA
jgi:hypothetical protein